MERKEGEKMNIFGVISKYDNSGRLQAIQCMIKYSIINRIQRI